MDKCRSTYLLLFQDKLSYYLFQDAHLALVMRVLLSTKSSQVEDCVKQLDNDQKDILMKYIYRGFDNPSEGSSAQLLVWHEKTFASAGLGCIVRVLTDRKQV